MKLLLLTAHVVLTVDADPPAPALVECLGKGYPVRLRNRRDPVLHIGREDGRLDRDSYESENVTYVAPNTTRRVHLRKVNSRNRATTAGREAAVLVALRIAEPDRMRIDVLEGRAAKDLSPYGRRRTQRGPA